MTSVDNRKPKKITKHKILKGSSEHKIERRRYLSQLIQEFNCTNSEDAKSQVLANLANFGYDPYNYGFFQELKVVELFLYQLNFGKDKKLTEFAIGGLCNCCDDDVLCQQIIDGAGISLIQNRLSEASLSTHTNVTFITSALTILMSLIKLPCTRHEILSASLENTLRILVEDKDARIRNLANIFLTDYFPSSAKRMKMSTQ